MVKLQSAINNVLVVILDFTQKKAAFEYFRRVLSCGFLSSF